MPRAAWPWRWRWPRRRILTPQQRYQRDIANLRYLSGGPPSSDPKIWPAPDDYSAGAS